MTERPAADRLLAELGASQPRGVPGTSYLDADLRGAALAGARITCFSLRGAILDGADLSGARLTHVDLTGASLRGANLEGALLEQVSACGANLESARCADSVWRMSDLSSVRARGSNWRAAYLGNAILERADFHDAVLVDARLIGCQCDDASFDGADFERANTFGATFRRSSFDGARRFSRCREIITEILAREIDGDLERAKIVGAIAMNQNWCYDEWSQILALQPQMRRLALEIFSRYPQSGFAEAFVAHQHATRRG